LAHIAESSDHTTFTRDFPNVRRSNSFLGMMDKKLRKLKTKLNTDENKQKRFE
jgi:hypothetical protein